MNKFVLLLICFFASTSLSAEMIGHVEYQLPKQDQNWKLENEMKYDKEIKSLTRIYMPENPEHGGEAFGVHVNDLPTDLTDQASLEKGMQMNFPNSKIKMELLEKDSNSVLYEWSISNDGQEKVHGWTRAFSLPKETVLLTYETDNMSKVSQAKAIWLNVLKSAKVVQ